MHGAAGLIFCGVRKHDWSVTLKKKKAAVRIVDFVKLPFKLVYRKKTKNLLIIYHSIYLIINNITILQSKLTS